MIGTDIDLKRDRSTSLCQNALDPGCLIGVDRRQNPDHLVRALWTWADCTSPKAAISTSIAEPP